MKAWKAEFFLFLVTFIWGATFLFTKIGLEDCPPSLYIIFRFLIALALSFALFGKYILSVNKKTFIQGCLLGLMFGAGFVFQTYGLKYTTVSKSAFITGMAVPLVPFVFWFVERKKIKLWSKVGVFVATVGLWLFTNPQLDNINLGDILTLISTIFWALYITYMDVFTRNRTEFSETAQLVMLQFIAATPLSLLTFLAIDFSDFQVVFTKSLIISLAFNSIMASFFVTFIHTSIQKYTTPVKAALIFSLEPVVAGLIAYIVLSEVFTIREYIGGAVLLSGVLISELFPYWFKTVEK